MTPSSSSWRTRRQQGEVDSPTSADSAWLVSRPSCCRAARMRRSTGSSMIYLGEDFISVDPTRKPDIQRKDRQDRPAGGRYPAVQTAFVKAAMTQDLRLAIVVNPDLPLGLIANTAGAIAIGLGAR